MKFHYVYITTNLINNRKYVGDRTCKCIPEEDKYLGSGTYFKKAEKFYGKEKFKKQIIETFNTREEAFNAQEKYINEYNTLSPNGYNISPKGGLRVSGCHSEETKEKIRESIKNKNKHKDEKF
jgi:hypothetical protein